MRRFSVLLADPVASGAAARVAAILAADGARVAGQDGALITFTMPQPAFEALFGADGDGSGAEMRRIPQALVGLVALVSLPPDGLIFP